MISQTGAAYWIMAHIRNLQIGSIPYILHVARAVTECGQRQSQALQHALSSLCLYVTFVEIVFVISILASYMPKASIFYCDCEKYCKVRKEVSRTTFYNHKKFRDPLAHFSPRFRAFLESFDGPNSSNTAHASTSNATQRYHRLSSRESDRTREAAASPPMKRSHLSAGVSDTTNERARVEEYDTPGNGDHVSRDDGPGDTPGIASDNGYHPESGRSDISDHSLLRQKDTLPPSSYTTNRTLGPHGIQPGDIGWDQSVIHPDALKTTIAFIKALQEASLDGSTVVLSREAFVRLRNPSQNLPRHSVDDNARLATDLHLGKPSEATYELNRAIFLRCYPDTDIPTYHKATRLVADITGVESVVHHTRVNSCLESTSKGEKRASAHEPAR